MNTFTGILMFIELYVWWILAAFAVSSLGGALYMLWRDNRGLRDIGDCDYCGRMLEPIYYAGDDGEQYCTLDCQQRGNG